MIDIPPDLRHRLERHRQTHLLLGWGKLSVREQQGLLAQLAGIALGEIESLFAHRNEPEYVLPSREQIAPIPVAPAEASSDERARGEEALRAGKVAALVVAGGQGSRLGFEHPKGLFPIGPVSGATLFQIHAEKILALSRRYGSVIPFLVMTSPATDGETRAFFQAKRYFGLDPQSVTFFEQGTMPTVSASSGQLLLESPGKLFLSPNGHGGTLTALAESNVLEALHKRGVEHVFYFQVDNPLVKLCDPGFVGRHVLSGSEASSKVVFKDKPEEKVGVLALLEGKCGIIEYTFMPRDLAAERSPDGTLRYRAGNPAIHLFSLAFLERVTSTDGLPYHIAHKAVAHYDPVSGEQVDPRGQPNALKFERFIFDALPLANRYLVVETSRAEEFSPVKNASGTDSPDTARAAQATLHARWLEQAGIAANGFPVEISPLFALDAVELNDKIPHGLSITGPAYLH